MWHILITSQSLRWVEKTSWLPQHRLRTDDLIPPLAYCRIITDTKEMWRFLCLKVIKLKWIVHCVSVSCLLNWSDFWLGWNNLHWTKNSRRRSHWWMSNCQENSVWSSQRPLHTNISSYLVKSSIILSPTTTLSNIQHFHVYYPNIAWYWVQSGLYYNPLWTQYPRVLAIAENTRKEPSLRESTLILGITSSLSPLLLLKYKPNNSRPKEQPGE